MGVFTLMNKNKKILDFNYNEEEHIITEFYRNYLENEKFAPFGLIKNNIIDKNDFNKWWKNRQIPASRNGLKQILQDLNQEDSFDLLDTKAYCLSLSDQYWVKRLEDDILWENINFFDNEFSSDIGEYLFSGIKTNLNLKLNLNSPDMTSNGNYEKKWKIINKDRYLIKSGGKMINQEPFNEVIATKLYERILNDNEYVKYEIIYDNDKAVSICKNFITKDTELIPAWKINEYFKYKDNENKYEHYIRCLNELNVPNANLLIDKMLVCDYILANKDRHYNNFGVIRNIETLEFISIAPIFDNGCSLWYDENDMYIGEFFLTKPFEEYEKNQLNLVKNYDWLDINKLNGFTKEAEEILLDNKLLSKERIAKIVNEIDIRIEYIKKLISN